MNLELRDKVKELLREAGVADEKYTEDAEVIALKKLDISNKEIASITGVSPQAITSRLKKITLEMEEAGMTKEEIAKELNMQVVNNKLISINKRRGF